MLRSNRAELEASLWSLQALRRLDGTGSARQPVDWNSLTRVLLFLTLIPASWLGIIPVVRPAVMGTLLLLGGYVILLTLGPQWLPVLRKADLVIVLDILVTTLVVLISGYFKSPFLYLYYLTIIEAATRLNLRGALAAAVASAGTIILLWVRTEGAMTLATADFWLGAFIAGGFFLALLFGMHIQESRAASELALAYERTVEGWSHALDLRDKETEGHSRRVTELTLRLARALAMPTKDLVHIRRGALLHDIGKMGIPDNIVHKPGPLTEEEWQIMRRHPVYAYDLLSPIDYLRPALDIPYCHHEKWDGTGYPCQLTGERIPLAARIFAVVDVWDALRSDRPYRPAWSEAQARGYIREQTGIHFDPRVVEVFLALDV